MRGNCEDQIDGSVGLPCRPEGNMEAPHVTCVERLVIFKVNATVPLPKVKAKAKAKQRVTRKARAKEQLTRLGPLLLR